MYRQMITVFAAASMAWAAGDSAESRLEKLESTMSSVLSRAGIHFGGEFRSQFLQSRIGGEGALAGKKSRESAENTTVDLNIRARPNDAIGALLILRLHQDWRNFFSDISNPVFTRWISIDGTVKNMFSYHVGDFRRRYSPLTLYSPDIAIEYEPDIFSRLRRIAMQEEFLGDNNRILQGIDMSLDAEVFPVLKELHANLLGARLRTAQTNIENGSMIANELEAAPMDRYLVGSNIDMTIRRGATLGGSFLDVFDLPGTAALSDTIADTLARRTAVWAVRGGIGSDLFFDPGRFLLRLDGEFAMSIDDSSWYRYDIAGNDTSMTLVSENIAGNALSVDLAGALKIGALGNITLSAGFLRNEPAFRNELAQSPTFVAQRIMNVENDSTYLSGRTPHVVPNHYSTFDALYRQVFKFTPSQSTNLWAMAPMRKIAYTNTIFDHDELAGGVASMLDPAVQLVMPHGAATANRSGIRASAELSLPDKGILVSGTVSSVGQCEGDSLLYWHDVTYAAGSPLPGGAIAAADTTLMVGTMLSLPETRFLHAGGGASVDFGSFLKRLPGPLRLSFGYTLSSAYNDGDAAFPETGSETEIGFLNAGAYFTFWKRASLLGGYQRITSDWSNAAADAGIRVTQSQWATGLEYKVGEGGTITGTIGSIAVSFEDNATGVWAGSGLPRDFDQMQVDLYMTVRF